MSKKPDPQPLPSLYTTPSVLVALIRAGDAGAIAHLVEKLKENDGRMTRTADALGFHVRTLYLWRDTIPALASVFKKHTVGRTFEDANAARTEAAQERHAELELEKAAQAKAKAKARAKKKKAKKKTARVKKSA